MFKINIYECYKVDYYVKRKKRNCEVEIHCLFARVRHAVNKNSSNLPNIINVTFYFIYKFLYTSVFLKIRVDILGIS